MRWLVALALVACESREYRCEVDEQCDVGEAGRCEIDQRCTEWDPRCSSQRRYTAQSGEVSETCFDDRVIPVNPCTEGQPPARPEGCFAAVCDIMPACCDTGWSSSCVQLAQQQCAALRCDTRIALVTRRTRPISTSPLITEAFDVRWDGSRWTSSQAIVHEESPTSPIATGLWWLAPAPGTTAPRLARIEEEPVQPDVPVPSIPSELYVDDVPHSVLARRRYNDVTSVDFDRDGRDTIVLGSVEGANPPVQNFLEVRDLTSRGLREFEFPGSALLAWGDHDHDAFPDAAIATAGINFSLATNTEVVATRRRVLTQDFASGLSGDRTRDHFPFVRTLTYVDIDGDRTLDLVGGGVSVRIELATPMADGQSHLDNLFAATLDCEPLAAQGTGACALGTPPGTDANAFSIAAMPSDRGATLWIAGFPVPKLHTFTIAADGTFLGPTEVPFAGTAPLMVLVARDLDHDNVLDLVGVDHELGIWATASASGIVQLMPVHSVTLPAGATTFELVRPSIAGAPL